MWGVRICNPRRCFPRSFLLSSLSVISPDDLAVLIYVSWRGFCRKSTSPQEVQKGWKVRVNCERKHVRLGADVIATSLRAWD